MKDLFDFLVELKERKFKVRRRRSIFSGNIETPVLKCPECGRPMRGRGWDDGISAFGVRLLAFIYQCPHCGSKYYISNDSVGEWYAEKHKDGVVAQLEWPEIYMYEEVELTL